MINNFQILDKFRNCSIVSGPQNSSKKNIFYELLKPEFKHLEKISWCPTNNVIFKKNIIFDKNIKFDTRLNDIGGSDQLFFKKLYLKGYEIRWNNKNFVIEKNQITRETLSWFLKRNYRYASSGVLIDRYSYGLFKGLIISIIKIFYNFLLSLYNFLFFPFKPKISLLKSLKNLVRAFSILIGIFGIFPQRYI